MKSKNTILLLACTALLGFAGFATATDPIDAKAPAKEIVTEGYAADELWLDGFASYNFNGTADPWSYGAGATFFPGGGNLGFNVDYAIAMEGPADNAHRMNVGATYRLPLHPNVDAYLTGYAGYIVNEASLDALGNVEFGDTFQYGARTGLRYAPLANLPVALFADIGRTWADDGSGYNSARAGLTIFF